MNNKTTFKKAYQRLVEKKRLQHRLKWEGKLLAEEAINVTVNWESTYSLGVLRNQNAESFNLNFSIDE